LLCGLIKNQRKSKMPRGGKRNGAGRKCGSVSKLDKKVRQEAAASGMMPLDFMLRVMRDKTAADARRDEMARAAAPYLHARLASHTISGDPKNPLRTVRTIELVVTNKREDFVTVADSRRALLSPAGTGGEI
jgi:hypothetical protein